MPRNGSGSYNLPNGPFVPSTVISSTVMNQNLSDLGTALTQSIANDGQTTPVANLPMATFRHTNVGNAVARTDYAAAGQVQDSSLQWLTSVIGTDTITASITPGLTAYTAGQTFRFVSAGANTTGTVTLNINGLGAKAITKPGALTVSGGDIPASAVITVVYDGTQFQLMGVASPASSGPSNSYLAFRNKLYNGMFTVNQRVYSSGSPAPSNNFYFLDRWRIVTVTQSVSFVVTNDYLTLTVPADGIDQIIEGVNIEGGTYVLNWTGTATATVNGTSRAKGEAFSLPANTNVTVKFVSGTLALPQLELGGVTPFEFRPRTVELLLCYRYYQKSYDAGVAPGTGGATALTKGAVFRTMESLVPFQKVGDMVFKAEMRATPTVTVYSPNSGVAGKLYAGADFDANAVSVGVNGGAVRFSGSVPGATTDAQVHWTAESEL